MWIPKRTIQTCLLRPFQERTWNVSVRCSRGTRVSIKNQRHPKLSKRSYSCAGKRWQFEQISTQDNLHTSSTNVVWTLWGWVPMCRILNKASHHGNVKLCWVRRIIEKKWYAHGCAQTPPRRRRPEIFKKLWLVPDTTKTRHEVLVVKNVVTALYPNVGFRSCITASTDHWCQTIRKR